MSDREKLLRETNNKLLSGNQLHAGNQRRASSTSIQSTEDYSDFYKNISMSTTNPEVYRQYRVHPLLLALHKDPREPTQVMTKKLLSPIKDNKDYATKNSARRYP